MHNSRTAPLPDDDDSVSTLSQLYIYVILMQICSPARSRCKSCILSSTNLEFGFVYVWASQVPRRPLVISQKCTRRDLLIFDLAWKFN